MSTQSQRRDNRFLLVETMEPMEARLRALSRLSLPKTPPSVLLPGRMEEPDRVDGERARQQHALDELARLDVSVRLLRRLHGAVKRPVYITRLIAPYTAGPK